jgi:acyl-CoA synthetase (AMP-forming)/AMP-acid ligase II
MVDKVKEGESAALFRNQRGIVVAPMFHMNALVFIAAYLGGGGSIVLMSKFNAEQFASAIEKHEVNVITGVPTMIALLYNAWTSMKQTDLSSVHTVYIGSAPVTAAIVDPALEMMPNSMVLNSYGTTETGGGLFGPHPEGIQRPPTSVGYPLPGIGIRLEGKTDNEGVLVVKAPSAMTEYLNLPELTAERIRDGWINTGDIFSVDSNGFFYFVGRNDDMFVCSGENIFPGEVERVLESHPSVDQASVVPVPDKIRGQIPVAWVVSSNGNVDETALQEYVRARAAPYIYPRKVWFLDELPLAGTSKIDRNLLTAWALDKLSARDDVA